MGCFVVTKSGGIHSKIRGHLVEIASDAQEFIEGPLWVIGLKKGAPATAHSPFKEDIRVGIQPSDNADPLQRFAVRGTKHKTSSGRENDAADSYQISECPLFQVSKVTFSTMGENLRDAATIRLRNEFI